MVQTGSNRRGHARSLLSFSEMETKKCLVEVLRHLELLALCERKLPDCIVIQRVYEAQDEETGGGYDYRIAYDIQSRKMAKEIECPSTQ